MVMMLGLTVILSARGSSNVLTWGLSLSSINLIKNSKRIYVWDEILKLMELIKINPQNPEKEKITRAIDILEHEGTVVYPTDTIYGLGVDISSENAIRKIYSLKERSYDKPLSVCVSQIKDISKIAYLDRNGEEIIKKILPGPFTIILRKKKPISPLLTAGGEKIGVRIPDSKICRELTRNFPITATSANLSGKTVPESVNEVIEQLGVSIDLVLDAGKSNGNPSTVIDLTMHPPKILRNGVNESLNINKFLNNF
jgi:L-threonylcarbamoyladenylate synthase